ncbi:hypothetical protein OJ996_25905 [Luteolibacter sp. GHJ8]|uniref:DUF1376 domain-containing protein n=1 Tax=Luteolibacter rhizosphaerae TaxID=2989719 RepID=A0ABT3GB37_9BACT|nr:hypothetical protein [Luteolibacter rhizosphaerae]MCW1917051.1 hypothetical protein [Luteolibacter rhizosphaerae]
MEYLNLETHVFRSPEFIGADPAQRGTWIALLGWCASQENGGRIAACRAWKDRMWQQLVGVTAEEVLEESPLWTWEGEDLVIVHYPLEQELALHARREGNAKGGRATSGAKAAAVRLNGSQGGRPPKIAAPSPSGENPSQTQEGGLAGNPSQTEAPTQDNPNVKEGKVKESKGRETRTRDADPPPPALSPAELKPIDRVKAELGAMWPEAPRAWTGRDDHGLWDSLPVLAEFSQDDWLACRCWVQCPQRIRDRPLWPRDRIEFVANAGQAIETIRKWWSVAGRKWWGARQSREPPALIAALPPASAPEPDYDPAAVWDEIKTASGTSAA